MKPIISVLLMACAVAAHAKEIIAIQSPYSASHSGTPAMLRIIDEANRSQDRYRFTLEFRPGGEQLLAVKALDEQPQTRLAIVAPKFVEHVISGRVSVADYEPVHALGDACWAVISNLGTDARLGIDNLRGSRSVTVGGVGVGNAAHFTSLLLADRYGFDLTYVSFRSNNDALMLMAGDNSINLVIDRLASFQQVANRNPRMRVIGMSCPTRHPDAPNTRTLREQGVDAPMVFNVTLAHRSMTPGRRQDLAQILEQATRQIGADAIRDLSDMTPPYFSNIKLEDYWTSRTDLMRGLLKRYANRIRSD